MIMIEINMTVNMLHTEKTDLPIVYRFFEMIKKILHNRADTIQTQSQK